jgi:uncharacterized protein
MKCTKCGGEFKKDKFRGVVIDRCSECKSIWLDNNELEELEDSVWADDNSKGSLFLGTQPVTLKCPVCGTHMEKINYRFYDLELEICPNSDGFYLDAHEEERMVELLKQDKKADNRKTKEEEDWAQLISRMKSTTFFNKMKSFFDRKSQS